MKKARPYLIILLGLLLLFFNQPYLSGACIILGIVMILEKIWPETWETGKEKEI